MYIRSERYHEIRKLLVEHGHVAAQNREHGILVRRDLRVLIVVDLLTRSLAAEAPVNLRFGGCTTIASSGPGSTPGRYIL